jgi:hypothetical protein
MVESTTNVTWCSRVLIGDEQSDHIAGRDGRVVHKESTLSHGSLPGLIADSKAPHRAAIRKDATRRLRSIG